MSATDALAAPQDPGLGPYPQKNLRFQDGAEVHNVTRGGSNEFRPVGSGESTGSANSEANQSMTSVKRRLQGAYTSLCDFIYDVHINGSGKLSRDRFSELISAVEALSIQGEGQKVNVTDVITSVLHKHGDRPFDQKSGFGILQTMGVNCDNPDAGIMKKDRLGSDQTMVGDSIGGPASTEELPEKAGRIHRLETFLSTTEIPEGPRRTAMVPVNSQGDFNPKEILNSDFFNAWTFSSKTPEGRARQDVPMLMDMFRSPMDLIRRYTIHEENLQRWIQSISDQYVWNAYHNWAHALEVTQLVFYLLAVGGGMRFFNYQDVLALFCASIAHDVGHRGVTNMFLKVTRDALAITYNDKAPLENMHSACLFETLNRPGHNFLQGSRKAGESWQGFDTWRSKVIAAVLATDMGQHMAFVDRFTARVAGVDTTPFLEDTKNDITKSKASKTDRRLLLEAFLHTADLGHNFKPFELNKWGVMKLEEEWFCQGDIERQMEIPISPNCDRHRDSLASTQSFFMEAFIRPLLEPFAPFVKKEWSESSLRNVDNNKQKWEDAVAKYGPVQVPILLKMLEEEQQLKDKVEAGDQVKA